MRSCRAFQEQTFLQTSSGKSGPRDAAELSALAHQIYEASVHPERWNGAVARVAASFGTTKGLLFTPYLAPNHGGLMFPAGIDEAALQLWASSYIDHDIWSQRVQAKDMWREGRVLRDEEMVPHDELLASRFYREFLSGIGIARVCAGFVFAGSPGLPATSIAVFRDAHEPAFDRSDQRWMELLVPHVSRSLGIMQRLDTAKLRNASLLASFDRLRAGVVLLNADMEVLHLNRAAKTVVERSDGIVVDELRRLETLPGRKRNLSGWLASLKDTPVDAQAHFLDGRQVLRENGRRTYMVQCVPVLADEGWRAASEAIRHIVFITDPSTVELPSASRLQKLYGLTAAQAKVTLELAAGCASKQVARKLRISEETVRSHVKAVYQKTRVNRQADLVRLVLSLSEAGV